MTNTEERKAYARYIRASKAERRALDAWFALPLEAFELNAKAMKTHEKRRATTRRHYDAWRAEMERIFAPKENQDA